MVNTQIATHHCDIWIERFAQRGNVLLAFPDDYSGATMSIEKGWSIGNNIIKKADREATWASLAQEYAPLHTQHNYGIVPLSTDIFIDLDPRNYKNGVDSAQALLHLAGLNAWPDTYTVKTPSGGLHLGYSKPASLWIKPKDERFPGIDFKAGPRGCHVKGPGVTHTKMSRLHNEPRRYEYSHGDWNEFTPCPDAILDLIYMETPARNPITDRPTNDERTYRNSPADTARFMSMLTDERYTDVIEGKRNDTLFILCCYAANTSISPELAYELIMQHWNGVATNGALSDNEIYATLHSAYAPQAGRIGKTDPNIEFETVLAPVIPTGTVAADMQTSLDVAKLQWDRNKQQKLEATVNNATLLFRLPSNGKYINPIYKLVYWDIFSEQIRFSHAPPWYRPSTDMDVWSENDITSYRAHLEAVVKWPHKDNDLLEAVEHYAKRHERHPIREYLAEREKIITPSVVEEMIRILNGNNPPKPHEIAAFRCWGIGAVRRVRTPGCFHRYVLTLSGGEQGGKSEVFGLLGLKKWHRELHLDFGNERLAQVFKGTWLVEDNEGKGFNKADANAWKSCITRKDDKFTLKHLNLVVDIPRQNVFCMSVNPDAAGMFLKGNGNTRIAHINCKLAEGQTSFNLEKFAELVPFFWGEMARAETNGEENWIKDEILLRAMVADREEVTMSSGLEAELLAAFSDCNDEYIHNSDIRRELGMERWELRKSNNAHIVTTTMAKLGRIKKSHRNPNVRDLDGHGKPETAYQLTSYDNTLDELLKGL